MAEEIIGWEPLSEEELDYVMHWRCDAARWRPVAEWTEQDGRVIACYRSNGKWRQEIVDRLGEIPFTHWTPLLGWPYDVIEIHD